MAALGNDRVEQAGGGLLLACSSCRRCWMRGEHGVLGVVVGFEGVDGTGVAGLQLAYDLPERIDLRLRGRVDHEAVAAAGQAVPG